MEGILFLGGDKRIIYAAEHISRSSEVCAEGLGERFSPPSGRYSRIVLPLPFSRDGVNINAPLSAEPLPLDIIPRLAERGALVLSGGTSPALERLCADNGLRLRDYFSGEELTLKNALLTAEGAMSLLITETDYALFDSSALILGYGRIAFYLARLLRAFRCRVTIAARNPVQREKALLDGFCSLPTELAGLAAESSDLVINTVPAALLPEDCFQRMRDSALYLELATRSARPEKDWAEAADIKYVNGSGLPGKYAPRTAGEAIAETITAAWD